MAPSEIALRRLTKVALVCDLIVLPGVTEETDEFHSLELVSEMRRPEDWTEQFGRQLEINSEAYGVHSTLLMTVREVDDQIGRPLPDDVGCETLAHEVLKNNNLKSDEVYAMLYAGPPRWRRGTLDSGGFKSLDRQLRRILEQNFANELSRVFRRWEAASFRDLEDRYNRALEARASAHANASVRLKPATRGARPERPKAIFTPSAAARERERGR